MLVPEIWDGDNHNVYQYQYFFDFDDKVYYTKADEEATKELLDNWKEVIDTTKAEWDHLIGVQKCDLYYYHNEFDKTIIINSLKEHMSNITKRNVVDVELRDDFWINVQHPNDIVPIHNHNSLYSFTWYLQIADEIREECIPQPKEVRTRGMIQFISSRTNDLMTFNPKPSDIFIFKSDHKHQVYPFHSDNIRIVMAGNIHSITFEDGETITV